MLTSDLPLQEGGVDLVCQLLCDLSVPEGVRHEAAAVLAQMTAPWLSPNHAVAGLTRHLPGVVQALTGTVRSAVQYDTVRYGTHGYKERGGRGEGGVAAELSYCSPSGECVLVGMHRYAA